MVSISWVGFQEKPEQFSNVLGETLKVQLLRVSFFSQVQPELTELDWILAQCKQEDVCLPVVNTVVFLFPAV